MNDFSGITDAMVKSFEPMIFSIVRNRRSCWDCLTWDEKVSAGYLGILNGFKTFDASKAKLSTWIYYHIEYAIQSEVKAHVRRFDRETLIPETMEPPSAKRIVSDASELLDRVLQCLSPRERRILIALFVDGKPRSQVAKEEGIGVSTVYNIRDCALRRVRQKHPTGKPYPCR